MCVACGLPTNHVNIAHTLGILFLVSFSLTTFVGAWWILAICGLEKMRKTSRAKKEVSKSEPINI